MNEGDSLRDRAFTLFDQGHYQDCCNLIRTLPAHISVTPLRVLEAVCLYNLGSLQEAEICLRDLRSRLSSSVEISLYLGKILEKKQDETARAEYAEAVRLDPDNSEALRGYARYLLNSGDHAAALSLLRKLILLNADTEDISVFMECCLVLNRADDGISAFLRAGSPAGCTRTFMHLLSSTGQYEEIIRLYADLSSMRSDSDIRLFYADALAHSNSALADREFRNLLEIDSNDRYAARYLTFLSSQEKNQDAFEFWSVRLSRSKNPTFRLMGVPFLQSAGQEERALALAEEILLSETISESLDISENFAVYRRLLEQISGPGAAIERMITVAKPGVNPAFIIEVARLCEETGRQEEARRLYLQAFRSDLTRSGLEYAAYLERRGELRERKKTLTYILKTLKNVRDLEFVALKIQNSSHPDDELISLVNHRFSERLPSLSLAGKELYARSLSRAAESALERGFPDEGLEHALSGLSIVPVESVHVAESLFALLIASKAQVLPDHLPATLRRSPQDKHITNVNLKDASFSWLSPEEEVVISYLRKHRVCHELDLRRVAGTHRVAGLMNRIMRRAEENSVHLIEKEGYSEFGEVYRYAGP